MVRRSGWRGPSSLRCSPGRGHWGLHSVPHAGETTGPQAVWDALGDLGAERIGHGISSIADPVLLEHLVDHRIPLEVCPSSNVCTHAVPALPWHPMPALIAAGVTVTLGADDPGMFDTTLNNEYRIAYDVFGLSLAELADLARTGVVVSFADERTKRRLLDEIADYVAEVLPST